MFRLEAFIDDRKLAKVMTVLDGLVVQMTVVPARNAVAKGGKMAEAGHPINGPQLVGMFIEKLRAAKTTNFASSEAIRLAETYGIPETTVWAALSNERVRKTLGFRLKERGKYVLTPTGAK